MLESLINHKNSNLNKMSILSFLKYPLIWKNHGHSLVKSVKTLETVTLLLIVIKYSYFKVHSVVFLSTDG